MLFPSVDRQESEVDPLALQPGGERRGCYPVTGMVECPSAPMDEITQEPVKPLGIPFVVLMRRRHRLNYELPAAVRRVIVKHPRARRRQDGGDFSSIASTR